MEENVMNANESDPRKVVLSLMGIDKKWVWHQGQWVDERSVQMSNSNHIVEIHDNEDLDDAQKSSWWKFWKK